MSGWTDAEIEALKARAAGEGVRMTSEWDLSQNLDVVFEQRRRYKDEPYFQHLELHVRELLGDMAERFGDLPPERLGEALMFVASTLAFAAYQGADATAVLGIQTAVGADLVQPERRPS